MDYPPTISPVLQRAQINSSQTTGHNRPEWIETMTDAYIATLTKLRDDDKTVADKGSDIRGRKVVDKNNQLLGKVDALLIDDKEQKVRFLEIAFIPVDAITKITDDEVHINQTAKNVAGAPEYDPALVNQTHFYEDIYGYYGMMPFWGPTYMYPTYPGRDPLDRN
jgi:sporulation protein YlmC with PRC-barrel domain